MNRKASKMPLIVGSGISYGDITRIGKIEIEQDPRTLQVRVYVHGFEFDGLYSCREHCIKALLWAIDLMDAQIKQSMLIPGGQAIIINGVDQDKLNENLKNEYGSTF